ncbi:AAA family ATPase [Roseofilum sp. BLCC_M143]|uniref:AAA family ATPase n=2 Tax=Roseofilum TaxID=1233426 RepID=A0ABT7BZP8_9CYAN|nr:AAA family ATPase [Roseofilum casamattae BLCC-M143]
MLNLAGYEEHELVYAGNRTLVYRGVRSRDEQPVIVKVLRNPNPSFKELVQFRNQYVLARELEHPHVMQPLSLERYGNSYALIMPDSGAIALSQYWRSSKSSHQEFFSLAIQISEALHYLSRQRIIHKNIQPANIIIQPETHHIELIDFSISSLLPKEQQQLLSPNVLEGSLSYISPEQTGRMNRGIDYRTDFYSLGVTFYELLVGKLPFTRDDSIELVHDHIAQIPQFPADCDIPPVLQEIVFKLMAKNAEDRYQSALGLKHDLQRCVRHLEIDRELVLFNLGEEDRSDRFIIPEKLYGREIQVETLLAAFDRVAQGQIEMMLVAGFSGIGKTAVVNEVHKPIVKKRGYFIKGKYDQFNRNIPFSAFVQAFRELMSQLLGESDEVLAEWNKKILQALGENAQVVIEVVPELERIIGPQPQAPELDGNAAQNRFNLLFEKFIAVFATQEHPLVIFLDDLQWADSASLNLLEVLMSNRDRGYLLLLGAYRDNEVFPTHPLILTLEELGKNQASISTITLEPLASDRINQLIADTLICGTDRVQPLTDFVYQQTQGNPFFTTQFLKGLHEDKLLEFEFDSGNWEWNSIEIGKASLSNDVVEFMASRLRNLPEHTRGILKLAACIGNQFDLETLSIVCETSKNQVASDLWEALQEGLVLPISENYKFFQKLNLHEASDEDMVLVGYRFLHDRVQQAAYSLIAQEQKQATHLKIGQQLLQRLSEEEQEEQLFTIVNHLNRARELILENSEREKLARLNLKASHKANNAVAYEASRDYCYEAEKFLDADSWETHYELRFDLAIATIKAEHLNYNLETATELCKATLEKAQTLLHKTQVQEFEILFKINENQMNESIALAREILIPLGITLPTDPEQMKAESEILRKAVEIPTAEIAALEDLPVISDREKEAVVSIMMNTSSAGYIAQPNLYPLMILHSVRYCMEYGNSALGVVAYTWHASILCGIHNNIQDGYEFGLLSLKLIDKFNARAFETKVRNLFNLFIRPWKEHLKNAVDDYPKVVQSGFDNGDFEYACYSSTHLCNYMFYIGAPLEKVIEAHQRYLPPVAKAQYYYQENAIRIYQQVVANLVEEHDRPQYLQGKYLDSQTKLPIWIEKNIALLVFSFYEAQTRLFYLFDDRIAALESGKLGWEYWNAAVSTPYLSEFIFYYSLVILAQDELSPEQIEWLNEHEQKVKVWAQFAPMNFQHKYDLIQAELCRQIEENFAAADLYDRAIAGAKEHQFLQEEALANELAAKFYLSWKKEKIAAGYMQEAYYIYAQWGAKAKTDRLEAKYPQLLSAIRKNAAPTSDGETLITNSNETSNGLDLTSVIKASHVLSEEISLKSLLSKLMHILIENAGATQGTLILNNSGTWEMTAQYIQGTCNLSILPLNDVENIPHNVINWVKRTQEIVLINNLSNSHVFSTDFYLLQKPTQSLVCTPILNQGQLIGILYLENHLTAEAFTSDRLEVLNLLTTQAAISINNARFYQTLEDKVEQRTTELVTANQEIAMLNQRLQAENLRLGAELDIARRVQEMILPRPEELNSITSLDIAGYMAPADEVGGDYYDVLVEDGVVTIGIGDVTGHGLESGLVMMMAQTVIRAMKELGEEDPVRFLNTVNRTLFKNVERMEVDRQLTLAILNYAEGYLSISGQHEEVLVIRADGSLESVDTLELGMTVGLIDDITEFIAQVTVNLEPGDGVVLYTDGIPEAENQAGQLYGLERLCEVVQQHWSRSAREIQEETIADVQNFIGDSKVFDDITLLVLKEQGMYSSALLN